MFPRTHFLVMAVLGASVFIAGCAGGGNSAAPLLPSAAPPAGIGASDDRTTTQTAAAPNAATVSFALGSDVSGSMTLRSSSSTVTVRVGGAEAAAGSRTTEWAHSNCPSVPPIVIYNPSSSPAMVRIEEFSIHLKCSVDGLLFGASAYQSNPVPAVLVSTKLGDAKGSGKTLTFTPTVAQLVFPAKTALTIAVLREASTAFTQLPAVANTNTVLTSNAPAVPNSLSIAAPAVSGGTTFQSACYLPSDPAGPGLGGVHVLGTPSFYCQLAPGQAGISTTFGGTTASSVVKFTLGPNQKPDLSLVGLDGPQILAPCAAAPGGQVCNSPAFAIPVYSLAYVSNDADIAVCVPATENADCNGVAGNPKAPAATNVPSKREFQLLFKDDPSYNAANTFGGVTVRVTGAWPACAIHLGSDDNADKPPGYSDPAAPGGSTWRQADFIGIGPFAEIDIDAKSAGTCTLDLTEDTGLKRTFAFQIAVH